MIKYRSSSFSILWRAGIFLFIAALGSPANAQTTTSTQCADMLVADLKQELGIPGIAVAVRKGDRLIFSRALGNAHVELRSPVTSSTIFQLSSSAKLFSGLVTMRLAEQGKLALDDSVTDHLPEAPPGWSSVTVRHLASMTARLPEIPSAVDSEDAGELEILASLAAQPVEETLAKLFEAAPSPDSGTGWKYGTADFFVLQQIIERIADAPYEEVVRREVFEPAGMVTATFWTSDTQVLHGAATDYYPDGNGGLVQREFLFPQVLFAAGGAAASLEDLLRLDDALRGGRLLSQESIDTMWTWQPLRNEKVVSYGIGWDLKDHAPEEYSAGHSGGYLTTFRRYMTGDLTVIVLTNGFTIDYAYMAPDNLASALAAVWEPSIIGLDEPGCSFEEVRTAQF